MTIITIHSDDGRQPVSAVIGTGTAAECTQRMQEIARKAAQGGKQEFVPVGDVQGRDLAYIVTARKRQLEAIGAVPKFPAKAKAKA